MHWIPTWFSISRPGSKSLLQNNPLQYICWTISLSVCRTNKTSRFHDIRKWKTRNFSMNQYLSTYPQLSSCPYTFLFSSANESRLPVANQVPWPMGVRGIAARAVIGQMDPRPAEFGEYSTSQWFCDLSIYLFFSYFFFQSFPLFCHYCFYSCPPITIGWQEPI